MTMTQNLKNENHYKDFHKNVTFLYIFFSINWWTENKTKLTDNLTNQQI